MNSINLNTVRQATTALAMAVVVLAITSTNAAAPKQSLKVGDKAPLVKGQDQDGKSWKLADFIGKKIVLLYFYPKDDTPGCTKEACGLRDRMADLKQQEVEVVGVSFDDPASHRAFREKHKLNFTLLADTNGKIANSYGARMNGRDMARRVSFLIGLDGKIAHITDNPSADVHLAEMKEAVARLRKR